MSDESDEIKWTETLLMRSRAIGPNVYYKRVLVSVTKFGLGFGILLFLITIGNKEIWNGRGPQVVLAGAVFGIFYRLLIEVMPAFVMLNETRLRYKGRRTRSFPITACEAIRITPSRGLLRVEFDVPRLRGTGLEHIVIAAPQSALAYLATLTKTGALDSTKGAANTEGEAVQVAQLNDQSKRISPYGGAFFGMGFPCIFFGIVMLAFPIVTYLFFGLARSRLVFALAISWPTGLILIVIGGYCMRIGLPWMRRQIERSQRTKTIK